MWRPAALVLAGILLYSNALSGPFILDDHPTVVENTSIRDLGRLTDVLNPERELPVAGRPLVNLAFALNYAAGGLDVTGYHVVNIALHIVCALLLFAIVGRTRYGPAEAGRHIGADVAFAAALLWLVHPLNTEAVNYVTQRTELMMALCYLFTLYASVRGWTLAAIVACAAGMACKESMVSAPLVVLLYDRTFAYTSFGEALRARWRLYAGLAATWIVLGALLWTGPRVHSAGLASGVSPWTYLLNQAVIIPHYLELAVWPRALVVSYGWPEPLTLAAVWPSALLMAALGVLTLVALARFPKTGFLGAWFFITLAPTSSVIPIATEAGAERRMYLPLAGLVVLAVAAAAFLLRKRQWPTFVAPLAVGLVALPLAAGTWTRNHDYAVPLELMQHDVERRPSSGVAEIALSAQLIDAGRHQEAIAHLRHAAPRAPRAHYGLGIELLDAGQLDEAVTELRTFIREQPILLEAVDAHLAIARVYGGRRQWADVVPDARAVLAMNPSRQQAADAELLLADALFGLAQYDEAAKAYSAHLVLEPSNTKAVGRLAVCFVALNRLTDAVAAFKRAVEIDPASGEAQRDLATALLDHGDATEAIAHAREAVRLRPTDADARELLARAVAASRQR